MSALVLKKMRDMGLSLDQAIELFEAMEEISGKPRSKNAERQARFRARKAERNADDVTNNVTCNAESNVTEQKEVSPTPPSRKIIYIKPPIVPHSEDTSESKTEVEKPAQPDWAKLIDRVWQVMTAAARRRTSRADIETGLKAAWKRGSDPELVVLGLEAYYRSPDATKDDGQYAKGAHRMIQNDRWKAFVDETKPPTPEQLSESMDALWGQRVGEYVRSKYWNEYDWGPRPGKHSCEVPSQILEQHGFTERKAVQWEA